MTSLRSIPTSLTLYLGIAASSIASLVALPACDGGSAVLNGDGGNGGDPDGGGADANGTGTHDDGGGCPAVSVALQPVVPTVLLLLDQSGSMTQTFGNGLNRWDAMKAALIDPSAGVVTQLQDSVVFGATLYTSHNGGPTCPVLTSVTPVIGNLAPIRTLLDNNQPDDDTPTGASIMGAMGILQAVGQNPDAPPSPKIIVLATDGEPDNCATPDPQTSQAKLDSIAAAQAAFAAGYRLFILSVGNEVGLQHQKDMANAGAGKPIGGAEQAPFYSAASPADLKAAFNVIINGVRECTFGISGTVDASTASTGTVQLNGSNLIYDDPNGWSLVDSMTMKLNGTACDAFLDDPSVTLTAEFPCGVVVQ
jgi:hypothetical protein